MRQSDNVLVEIHVRPVGVHGFLLSHPRHQEKFKPELLFVIACSEEFLQVFLLVNFWLLLNVLRPVVFLKNLPRVDFLRLQKTDDVFKFVGNTSRGLILLVPQEGREFQQVFPFDEIHAKGEEAKEEKTSA